MAINIKWHKIHKLHKSAGMDARIDWHTKHQRHCACRPMPMRIQKEIAKRAAQNG